MLYLIYIYNGCNVLCSLSAGGLLWVRNSAQKGSVKSVSSVREKPPQRVVCVSSHRVGAFYFSQKNTEEQNTQAFTETLSQPISQNLTANIHHPTPIRSLTPSPSPNGEGSDHRNTPPCPPYVKQPISSYHQPNRGNLTYYSPLHSERGWG